MVNGQWSMVNGQWSIKKDKGFKILAAFTISYSPTIDHSRLLHHHFRHQLFPQRLIHSFNDQFFLIKQFIF